MSKLIVLIRGCLLSDASDKEAEFFIKNSILHEKTYLASSVSARSIENSYCKGRFFKELTLDPES